MTNRPVPKNPVVNDGQKACMGKCGQDLPATSDYFDRDVSKSDGLRNVCKMCRADEREMADNKAMDERIRRIDNAALNMLDRLGREGSTVPHMAELYQRLIEAFDGVGGFAAHFMASYLTAAPGSSVRQKMLDRIISLGIRVSEAGAAQIPVELMNDEDLQIELQSQAKKFLVHYVDGEVKEAS